MVGWRCVTLLVLVVALAGCVLPGERGWECDNDGDCQRGLACRSMHGDQGWDSICAGPDDEAYVGSKGNWGRLIAYSLVGVAACIALVAAVVRWVRGGDALPRRRRRR
jgi:hypothetical protein